MQMKQWPDMKSLVDKAPWPEMKSWTENKALPEMRSWAENKAWPEMRSWADKSSWPAAGAWAIKSKKPQKKRWSDLSMAQRICIIVLGIAQVSLLAGGLWDLHHRKQEELRGDRRFWWGFMFVNWVGPIAYFTYGRKNCPLRMCGGKAEEPDERNADQATLDAESTEFDGPAVV